MSTEKKRYTKRHMSRLAFYRKYRSQLFSEVVGQDHVVQVLGNAIKQASVAHAYIFSGPRGTGKTSIARIMAKAVNTYATSQQYDELSDTLCQRINQGVCADVVEIDAASNTGVDNIRDLNEKVGFAPIECAVKFYIIDEVHMLSSGAFNALLKTLEEPPAHTVFILATTEPHKIPMTIHSRCQHLRFRNLTVTELVGQLQYVAQQETLTIDDHALTLIARNAEGCMRDALSLLDQLYSFIGPTIQYHDVTRILGMSDTAAVVELLQALYAKRTSQVVLLLEKISQEGLNPAQLMKDLMAGAEHLLSVQAGSCAEGFFDTALFIDIATLSDSVALLHCFAAIESEMRWFSDPHLLLKIRLSEWTTNGVHTHQHVSEGQQSASQSLPKETRVSHAKLVRPHQTKPMSVHPKHTPSIPTQQVPTQKKEAQQVVGQDAAMSVTTQWTSFLNHLKKTHTGLYTILRESRVMTCVDQTIEIELFQPAQFFVEKLHESSQKKRLETELETFFKEAYTFAIAGMKKVATLCSPTPQETRAEAPLAPQNNHASATEEIKDVSLNAIVDLFDGRVV